MKNKELLRQVNSLSSYVSKWLYMSFCRRSYVLNRDEINIVAYLMNSILVEIQQRNKRSDEYEKNKEKIKR